MSPFFATYTPLKVEEDDASEPVFLPDRERSRQVLVLGVFAQPGDFAIAIFIDSDRTLREDGICRFTECMYVEAVKQ